MKNILYLSSLIFFISCANKLKADLLVKNATIYTVNENFDLEENEMVEEVMKEKKKGDVMIAQEGIQALSLF